jgi:hypothetical protein
MSCIEADFIAPRNAPYVTIMKANVVPVMTSAAFASTETGASSTVTTQAVGTLAEITIPTITFTGSAAALTAAAITALTAPVEDCYWTIEVSVNGTKATGLAKLSTAKVLTFYSSATLGTFSATECIIYPCVLHYKTA